MACVRALLAPDRAIDAAGGERHGWLRTMTVSPIPRLFEPRRHGWLAARLALAMIAAAATESIGLMLLAPMLIALGGAETGEGHQAGLMQWLEPVGIPVSPAPMLGIFVALVVLRAVIVQVRTLLGQSLEVAVVDTLRFRAWSALLHCDWRKLSAMKQSDNASLLISEIDRVGFAVRQGISALAVAVTLVGISLAGLAIAPGIAIGMGIGGLLTLWAFRRLRLKANLLGEQLSAAFSRVYSAVGEGLGALRVIKSFGKEADVAGEMVHGFARLRSAERAFLVESGLGQAALQIGGSVVLALGVWLAISHAGAGVAVILPFVALFARALPLLGALQSNWQNWSYSGPAMAKIQTLIAEAESAREDDALADEAPDLQSSLSFESVVVRFPGRDLPALDRVSLDIPAGKTVLITGPSGSGKSTLADLAGGLIAPDAGLVKVDGVPLQGGLRRAWRSRVAYVQQDPVLFDGTIRDNLLWADQTAGEEDLHRVLREASAQFVLALPDGLGTVVGEGGHWLSGGERQRIVLARALLRSPRLLILDEATSALDTENETAIAEAISALRDRMTVLIIGHRGALQSIADHMVTLHDGRIVPKDAEGNKAR